MACWLPGRFAHEAQLLIVEADAPTALLKPSTKRRSPCPRGKQRGRLLPSETVA